jgi:hypothetical protein
LWLALWLRKRTLQTKLSEQLDVAKKCHNVIIEKDVVYARISRIIRVGWMHSLGRIIYTVVTNILLRKLF